MLSEYQAEIDRLRAEGVRLMRLLSVPLEATLSSSACKGCGHVTPPDGDRWDGYYILDTRGVNGAWHHSCAQAALAEGERLRAGRCQHDDWRERWQQAERDLAAHQAVMRELAEAATLKRNTQWAADKLFKGEWTVIPTEDFERLRNALAHVSRVAP